MALFPCYFYTQDKDGYQLFQGALPHAVTWADTPDTLLARLGPVKNNIVAVREQHDVMLAKRRKLGGGECMIGGICGRHCTCTSIESK